jgi:hypothetical protein
MWQLCYLIEAAISITATLSLSVPAGDRSSCCGGWTDNLVFYGMAQKDYMEERE